MRQEAAFWPRAHSELMVMDKKKHSHKTHLHHWDLVGLLLERQQQ